MKKTLSLALVAVLGLGVTASSFAFYPEGEWQEGRGMKMWAGPTMMFGGEEGLKWWDNQKGWKRHNQWQKDALFWTAVQTAVANKDYDAFVKAWNEGQSKITAPTAEEFAQRVTMHKAKQAVEDAITAGNYESFKTALANLPKTNFGTSAVATFPTIPTQDEFNKMVTHKKNAEAMKNAVTSNDYNAFLAAWNANKPSAPTKDQFTKMTEKVGKMVNNLEKKMKNGVKRAKKILKNSTQNQ